MKQIYANWSIFSFILMTLLLLPGQMEIYAQDDEARQQSGLPTFIGNRPDPNPAPGARATITGTLQVQGLTDEATAPIFTVAILSNGTLINRQKVKNRGAFTFSGVTTYGATLIVEADNLEVASYPLGQLVPAPLSNRQDIIVNWLQVSNAVKRRSEADSIVNAYQRSEENQKLFEKASLSVKEKKTDNAVKLYKQVLEKDDKDFVLWTELGSAYFTLDKLSEAENSYAKALSLKNDFQPALLNLGKLYLHQKNYEKSIETLTKLLTLDAKSADANHYLGEAYLQSKKGSKAVVYLSEAINLAPVEKAEIHLRLAALYNAAGVKDRAVAEYKAFLEKVPKHPEKSKIEKYISENSK